MTRPILNALFRSPSGQATAAIAPAQEVEGSVAAANDSTSLPASAAAENAAADSDRPSALSAGHAVVPSVP